MHLELSSNLLKFSEMSRSFKKTIDLIKFLFGHWQVKFLVDWTDWLNFFVASIKRLCSTKYKNLFLHHVQNFFIASARNLYNISLCISRGKSNQLSATVIEIHCGARWKSRDVSSGKNCIAPVFSGVDTQIRGKRRPARSWQDPDGISLMATINQLARDSQRAVA